MQVEQLGDGEPELALVGSIHGDEPCGAHAVKTLLAANPAVERPVKCIIANERALDRGVRYTETDMNRAFPGDPSGKRYEERLAAEFLSEIRDCTVFSMHSTQSHERPFAIVDETGPLAETICPYLSVESVVETAGFVDNTLVGYADVIELECGLQGSTQAKLNAVQLVWEFLRATGALAGRRKPSTEPLPVFQLRHRIPKPRADSYDVHVSNFERVDPGTPYASVDEEDLVAEETFYPVLVSPYGYDTQFGFAASRTDELSLGKDEQRGAVRPEGEQRKKLKPQQ